MTFYKFVRALCNIIFKILYRINVKGLENVPMDNKLIVCSNHTSLLDPIVLAITIPREISFMAKKELFKNKLFGKIIERLNAFPVDREGSDLMAVKKAIRVLRNGGVLGIFPEGTRVNEMSLDNTKAGIGLIALKTDSKVLPVHISTNYKLFSKIDISIKPVLNFTNYKDKKTNQDDFLEVSKEIIKSIYN